MKHVIRNIYHVEDRADVMKAARHLAEVTRGNIGLYFLFEDEPMYSAFVILHHDKKHYTVDVVGFLNEWDLPDLNNAIYAEKTT